MKSDVGDVERLIEQVNEHVSQFSDEHEYDLKNQGLVLGEESGELQNAILEAHDEKLFSENVGNIDEEIGDVLYTVWTIAELTNTDPLQALLLTAIENAEREDESDG